VRDAMGSLVQQLTANPDVTRMSLPAVFLYPYSVLELGAFRSLRFQSELFKVKHIKDPRGRLLAMTRWFCSCMERMENMSKKPFNPVLGEELSAWVDHPVHGRTSLLCEQVSHHPPISAVVMVNEKEGVEFNSSLRFGITFNGNSVSCRLEGRASVTLKELNETYAAPNWVPDVVIQNVLFGTRRQLWWGDWSLSCEQTGLGVSMSVTERNAKVGWFSYVTAGEYENVVEGKVFRLNDPDRTPIKRLEGLAGIKIFCVDEASGQKDELFDCDAMKMEEIHFQAEDKRPPYNSLVIWKKTVDALLVDDLAVADEEKLAVEQSQREIRKQREADGHEWVPKYFALNAHLGCYFPIPGLVFPQDK